MKGLNSGLPFLLKRQIINELNWINRRPADGVANRFCFFIIGVSERNQLNFIIDKCLHCRIGNPVIIFENGRFPVFTRNPWQREKCGLMLEFDDNLVSGITFCFVFLNSDNPYLFEKKCTSHLD
jgi:hypothetical protein